MCGQKGVDRKAWIVVLMFEIGEKITEQVGGIEVWFTKPPLKIHESEKARLQGPLHDSCLEGIERRALQLTLRDRYGSEHLGALNNFFITVV